MHKIGSCSISGTAYVIKMIVGMDMKYIKCMSHKLALFGYFALGGDD